MSSLTSRLRIRELEKQISELCKEVITLQSKSSARTNNP